MHTITEVSGTDSQYPKKPHIPKALAQCIPPHQRMRARTRASHRSIIYTDGAWECEDEDAESWKPAGYGIAEFVECTQATADRAGKKKFLLRQLTNGQSASRDTPDL